MKELRILELITAIEVFGDLNLFWTIFKAVKGLLALDGFPPHACGISDLGLAPRGREYFVDYPETPISFN